MAKVSEIKFDINSVEHKINVNCTSSGEFNANIPPMVAETLRIGSKITANTLKELTEMFNQKLAKYKEAQTTEELYILVAYQAVGRYAEKMDGGFLFPERNSVYNIDTRFGEVKNALGLDFFVAIKETVDGKDKWFEAKLGKDFSWIEEKKFSQPDIYHRDREVYEHRLKRYKKLPFNETALATLNIAQERLRTISEMLFNFIIQDEEQILLTLTNQKLLQ